MSINVKIENVYGKKTIYPVCEKAQLFAKIAGTKTLTMESIQLIKQLGYGINVQSATLETL